MTLAIMQAAAVLTAGLTLVAATARLLLPAARTSPLGLLPPWVAVAAAGLGLLVALAGHDRRAAMVGGWVAGVALLLVAADGLAFDVIGLVVAAIGLVTGAGSGPVDLRLDWPGFATRAPALVAGVNLMRTALRRRHGAAERTDRMAARARLAAYPAAALALGYGALKAAWGLGSQIGLARPDGLGEGVSFWTPGLGDTVVLAAIGVALALALARPWGRRLPRWLPIAGAWIGAVMLVPVGLLGSYVTFTGVGRALEGGLAPWVTFGVYPWFLMWGLTLAVAGWSYQHRTRRG